MLGQAEVEIPKFDLMQFLQQSHELLGIQIYHWILWLVIFVFIAYIYNKVFRTAKLPILKNAIVYLLLLFGGFILLIFEVDAGLPIVYSLSIAIILMLIVRVRYWVQGRTESTSDQQNNETR